jgi:hypothetical protein
VSPGRSQVSGSTEGVEKEDAEPAPGHSLQFVGRRKSLHVCNAPKADAKSEPWQPVTKGHGGNRREPEFGQYALRKKPRIGATISKKDYAIQCESNCRTFVRGAKLMAV